MKINKLIIHMYKIGTGDCFVLKFYKDETVSFKMLIDCGCWNRKFVDIRKYVNEIKKDVDNHIDVLVVTHEHTDHVLGFQAGEKLLTNGFTVDQIWMGWPENDGDEQVKQWKEKYGEKKRALALVARSIQNSIGTKTFQNQYKDTKYQNHYLGAKERFSSVLNDVANLHVDSGSAGKYKGSLKGMAVVKEKIAKNNITYFNPGDIIDNVQSLEGIRMFVLGPPKLYEEVKKEHGESDESFKHNKEVDNSDLFLDAFNAQYDTEVREVPTYPFDKTYISTQNKDRQRYVRKGQEWRRIDYEWLFSSGAFALRMESLTNNLSLVLAIEFVDSGKIILFPGDAEYGSWKSWHDIDWDAKIPDLKTKDLLKRTVFYKVAHHLSHNGTAKKIGLDMMTNQELVAMATLDYNVISSRWKNTMPNKILIKELLEKTKGRTIIMNDEDLFYDVDKTIPLKDKIDEYRNRMTAPELAKFNHSLDQSSPYYTEYVLEL